jgi:hypothetical protein
MRKVVMRMEAFCRVQTFGTGNGYGYKVFVTTYPGGLVDHRWFDGLDEFSTAREADDAGWRAVPPILALILGEE